MRNRDAGDAIERSDQGPGSRYGRSGATAAGERRGNCAESARWTGPPVSMRRSSIDRVSNDLPVVLQFSRIALFRNGAAGRRPDPGRGDLERPARQRCRDAPIGHGKGRRPSGETLGLQNRAGMFGNVPVTSKVHSAPASPGGGTASRTSISRPNRCGCSRSTYRCSGPAAPSPASLRPACCRTSRRTCQRTSISGAGSSA